MDEQIQNSKTDQSNFFVRLFRGDIALPITYWVYGVGMALLFRLGHYIIEVNFMHIVLYEHGITFIKSFNLFAIVVNLFLSIAIWRSASKYVQSPNWAMVAKVLVIIRMLVLAKTIYLQYFSDSQVGIQNEILISNKSLPIMVDESTRFDRMSLIERDIYYHYTIIDLDKLEVDTNYFKVMMHKSIEESSCKDKAMLSLLKEQRKLIFEYKDKNNELISEITLDIYNCS